MSGLVLVVTVATGGGPGSGGRRVAGLLLVRASRCVPSHRRETTAEHLRQPGAVVAAGDPREIANVEPGAGNNRAVGTARVFLRQVLAGHDAQACEPSGPP